MDVNVQEDLNAVNDQITKLVEELNKMTAARENLLTQIQNLNGVAMYLRGKLPAEDATIVPPEMIDNPPQDLERIIEYPDTGE